MEIDKFSPKQITQLQEIGSYLHSRREELSLSLEQISGGTQISLRVLRALESGNYQQLPEPIYLRGLIRLYGNALKIDGTALAKSLSKDKDPVSVTAEPESESEPETDTALTQKLSLPKIQISKKAWSYLLYILLLAGAVYGLFSLLKRSPGDQKAVEKPSTLPVETTPPATPPTPESTATPPATPPTPESTATPPATPPTPESTTTPPATEASEETAPVSAKLNLEGDSWIQVKVDGKTEFEGILNKGKEESWTAQKQITIRVGNAGAVKLSQNQEPAQVLGNPGEVKEVTVTPKN